MPDLQSELSKLANAWDSHEQSIRQDSHATHQEKPMQTQEKIPAFKPTGVVSRDVFEFVRSRPFMYTSAGVLMNMTSHGYKKSTVSALITQMKRNGMLEAGDGNLLFTNKETYAPIANPYDKPSKQKAKAKKAKAGVKATQTHISSGIAALTPAPEVKTTWDAETALANLSVKDAHALWVELNKMFGGK